MFKSFLLAGLAATFFSVAASAPAQATVLDFTLTIADPNSDTASWSQSDSPTPVSYNVQSSIIAVSNPSSSFGTFADVNFNTSAKRGGIFIYAPDDVTLLFGSKGPVIYSGTAAAPTFAPGVFDLSANNGGVGSGDSAVLTITAAAVPEAATWAMMLVGLGVVGAVARRRQVVRVAYA